MECYVELGGSEDLTLKGAVLIYREARDPSRVGMRPGRQRAVAPRTWEKASR